ncbi:MAG: hypothetical protein OXK17_08325 [Thaumarchaeota archaeon]|nr:hypothetical protein [Nitrososphaerota archaeon]
MPLKCPDCGGDCYGKGQDHQPCDLASDGERVFAGEHCQCQACGKEHVSGDLM